MEYLLGKTPDALREIARSLSLNPFVGNQLADWLYKKRVSSWEQMVNISKASKAVLQQHYELGTSSPCGCALSCDGTKKYLFAVDSIGKTPVRGLVDGAGVLKGSVVGVDKSRAESLANGAGDPNRVENSAHQSGCGCGAKGDEAEIANRAEVVGAVEEVGKKSFIEAVMIPEEDRKTLCVSSQAGCKMACRFCMTGRGGWHGNLSVADILNQFISIEESQDLTNAVFMGMGEPLDNYDAVSQALNVLTAPWGYGWSPKRITLSTIGVLPELKRYLDEQRCHVAVSLHNPFPEERATFMPIQKAYDLRDIVALLRTYDFTGQRRVSFEYTMFSGWNDSKRHADALIRLLKGLECRVNLIRFHKIPDFPYESSSFSTMESFRNRLNNNGITCTIRASRGEDILAACGMLAGKQKDL